MNHIPFQVMDASAGSGKTRNLVKAVLLQALKQNDPIKSLKPILALTFTNKAAAEMKHRLLDYLIDFTKENPEESDLFKEVEKDLGLGTIEVRSRAIATLKHLLHHYNDLSFGTLDSFTSRLVRTFAKDMALSESFEITLDLESLLIEATDAVLSLAGRDKDLTNILVRFVEQKLEDERSHNIDGALLSTAKKLMEERHREPLDRLRDRSPEQLMAIRNKLLKRSNMLVEELKKIGKQGLDLIHENDLNASMLARGQTGIYGYFSKASVGDIAYVFAPNTYVTAALENGKWYSGKATANDKLVIDSIADTLGDLALTITRFAHEQASFVLMANKIGENIFSLATLNALNQELNNLSEARNTLPLAAFNQIVHEQLLNEPSQYIYERLGERYNHFYLDEFQDTSLLQWGNLEPLIVDSIASTGTALIVGDAKQSIYRWRNGEAEQFIDLSINADNETFQFPGDAKLIPLGDNWRSLEAIVNFNNSLFTHIGGTLENEGYRNLYEHASQVPKKGTGGLVSLRRLPKEDFGQLTLEHTMQAIHDLLAQGYAYSDMAILVRNHTSGAEVVQLLTSANIPVISNDSLLIGNSYEGKLLAGATALRTAPENKAMRWLFADALLQRQLPEQKSAYQMSKVIVHGTMSDVLDVLEPHFNDIRSTYNQASDLNSFVKRLMRLFGLSGTNNAFAETYLQAIYDFVDRDQGTDFDFVRWWLEEGYKVPVSAAENMNAVQVVTIHKSKGLQYPVVLVPFANWPHKVGPREAWINLDPEQYEGLEQMIVNVTEKDAHIIGGPYESTYHMLYNQEIFDSVNMLYVACTRAIERLYVHFPEDNKKGTITSFIHDFLDQQEEHQQEEGLFIWGVKSEPLRRSTPSNGAPLEQLRSSAWQERLKLARTAPPAWQTAERDARDWGNRIHYILSLIENHNDADHVLSGLKQDGRIRQEEQDEIERLIYGIINHPTLAAAFAPENRVYNERDILLPTGDRKRPDRIVQRPNGELILLDYKTGAFENKHQKQITEYGTYLEEMGFIVSEKHLVYSGDDLQVVTLNEQ